MIDCIERKSLEDAWWAVKDGGVLISIFQEPEEVKPAGFAGKDIKNLFFVMETKGTQLAEVTKLIDEGNFVPALDSVFQLGKFEEAFAKLRVARLEEKLSLIWGLDFEMC